MRYLTSIRGRLLLLVLASALPAIVLICYTALKTRELDIAEARTRLQGMARLAALDLEKVVRTSQELQSALSERTAIRKLQEPECSAALARALQRSHHFLYLVVIGRDRLAACDGQPKQGQGSSYADWRHLDRAFAGGEPYVASPVAGTIAQGMGLPVVVPVLSPAGEVSAALVGLLDLASFSKAFTRSHAMPRMTFTIWDEEGAILFLYPDAAAWAGRRLADAPLVKAFLAQEGEGAMEVPGPDGVLRLHGFAPLRESGDTALYLSVGVAKDELLADSDALFARTLALLGIFAALTLAAAWLLGHRLIWRQVQVLTETAGRFGSGQLDARVARPGWRGELGVLAQAFDGMAEAFQRHVEEIRQSGARVQRLNADLEQRVRERTAQLEASKNEIEDLYNHAPCGYHSLDSDGVFVRINDTELAWLGYDREEVIGRKRFTDVLTPESVARFRERFPVFKDAGFLVDAEFDFVRRDGTLLPVSLSATAIRDAAGRFVMSRTTIFDISDRRAARKAREARDRVKSEFLAHMSHELRTPLNAVIGFSEALQKGLTGGLNALQQEFVADILKSGEHLLSLINDILDLSKIEAGMMDLEREAVDLPALLQAGLTMVRELALTRRIRLACEAEAGLTLQADARKCRQMVYNLLANAVKFTPDGGQVTIAARHVGRAEIARPLRDGLAEFRLPLPAQAGDAFVEITVADTGIGMPAAKLDTLFQPFVQIDSGPGRRYEGTGLGLAIVRRLAELHGGSVAVASDKGRGAVFTVWLAMGDGQAKGRQIQQDR